MIRRRLPLQLHDDLGADSPPVSGGVLAAEELCPQALPQAGDHIVHDEDGTELPPGGVGDIAGLRPGRNAPHRREDAAQTLQRRDAAPDQAVDLSLGEAGRRPAKAPQRRAVHWQGRVPLRRQHSGERRRPKNGGLPRAAPVQHVRAHQHHALMVQRGGVLQHVADSLPAAAHDGNALPAILRGRLHVGPQRLVDLRRRAVRHHDADAVAVRQGLEGLRVIADGATVRHPDGLHLRSAVLIEEAQKARHADALAVRAENGLAALVARHRHDASHRAVFRPGRDADDLASLAPSHHAGGVIAGVDSRPLMCCHAQIRTTPFSLRSSRAAVSASRSAIK